MISKLLRILLLYVILTPSVVRAYWPTLPPRWHYRGLFKNWEGWRYAHDWKPCTETGEEYGDLVTYCTNDKEEHQRIKKYKKLGPPYVWIYYFGT